MKTNLPKFKGKVYTRNSSEEYKKHAEQYATTSRPKGTMDPEAIIYVADDNDILMAIEYATDNNLAIAVRSGGHQYKGYSSTTGNNIQLDMSGLEASDPQNYPYTSFKYDKANNLLRIGAGLDLLNINNRMADLKMFVPHGECPTVGLGGHAQTGGYSIISRSFGLLADYIQSFEIITANGVKRTIDRDSSEPSDVDLFFAMMGGSPGNFGVLTHVTIKPLFDKDYPKSRGLSLVKRCLDVLAEMNDDAEFPGDYNYSVVVIGASAKLDLNKVDDKTKEQLPEIYDKESVHYSEHPSFIVVSAVWANLGGKNQDYDDSFFKKIRKAVGKNTYIPGTTFDGKMTMSKIMQYTIWHEAREFPWPYVRRLFMSTSTSLTEDSFPSWVAERLEKLNQHDDCRMAAQFVPLGGKYSVFRKNGKKDDKTALSWRKSSTCFAGLNAFHNAHGVSYANQWSEENVKEAIGENGKLSKQDHRLIWAPYGSDSLDKMEHVYFESHTIYERLLKIKQQVDPNGIFTPNLFCIGAKTDGEEDAV